MPPRPLVIYVEHDDQVVLQTLLEFVTDLGNTAAGFRSLDEVRVQLETTTPTADVLITSLDDGDEDDVELLQQLHQQHPKLAVILITNGAEVLTRPRSPRVACMPSFASRFGSANWSFT